jgi:DNA-binding NtrC family response regulator
LYDNWGDIVMQSTNILFKNVLLVDDDVDEFPILQEALEEVSTDLKVSFINGGYKLDLSQPIDTDIIFLDINMPGCDGFECLKKIRQAGYKVPVIMYTTSGHVDQIIKAYDMGATLFMIKPNGYSKLVNQMERLFEHDWNNPEIISRSYFKDGTFIPV